MKTYREHIFEICSNVNKEDPEELLELCMYLAGEATNNFDFLVSTDKKLQEVISAAEYKQFSTEIAKKLFHESISRMEDGEFKQFVLEHEQEITKDE